ncbi:hypothetical protein DVH24_026391 [Malus domestica]|uniref:Uncharacterized protein n=1 Tax=Malus domestica TaxID=3750 RepID=A0A498KNI4_MALDO|nr:hypothetical protein DVH24_026391 [Malus domestica]
MEKSLYICSFLLLNKINSGNGFFIEVYGNMVRRNLPLLKVYGNMVRRNLPLLSIFMATSSFLPFHNGRLFFFYFIRISPNCFLQIFKLLV